MIVWWLVLYSWSCLSKIISYDFLLCSTVIGLDLESHSHSREKVQFFETRLRIIFLALAWRDEIEIIIWPFSYFETRTRFHFVTLMFRDEIETSENHFSWSSEKNEADSHENSVSTVSTHNPPDLQGDVNDLGIALNSWQKLDVSFDLVLVAVGIQYFLFLRFEYLTMRHAPVTVMMWRLL